MPIPRHFTGNAIMDALVRINIEAEAQKLSRTVQQVDEPEFAGLGRSIPLAQPANSDLPLADRAKAAGFARFDAVQRVALHGAESALIIPFENRVKASENPIFLMDQADAGLTLCTVSTPLTVQPLSIDKKTKYNGCTVVLSEHTNSALRVASPDNGFVSPRPARTARLDNQPCTAQAMQEVIPHPGRDEEIRATPAPVPPADLSHLSAFDPRYLRCDFFDNGPVAPGTKKGRGRSRYKVNMFAGDKSADAERYKLSFLSEPRYFKRSIPKDFDLTDPFYAEVWRVFGKVRKVAKDQEMLPTLMPVIAHIKDCQGHVVPHAAAILWQLDGEPTELLIFVGSSQHSVILSRTPKGAAKCMALKAMGYREKSGK